MFQAKNNSAICLNQSTLNDVSSVLSPSIIRCLSDISEMDTVHLSVDLVSAARRTVGFLRSVNECQWLHQRPTIIEAIRRYDKVWMPLISNLTVVGSTPPLVLPPFDVEWVWFCHTLNPVGYKKYCESRFSKLIGKPSIFNEENEEYALMRCKEIWVQRYPAEPFENEVESDSQDPPLLNEDLFNEVQKHKLLYSKFSQPYLYELVYLIAARQRYKGFLYMIQRFGDGCFRFVPAFDILLMLLTHQSYPTAYADDLKDMWENMAKVVGLWETVQEKEVEETNKIWERTFDEPYEKAGGEIAMAKRPIYWEISDVDVNTKYKSMIPRFLLEVCIFVRLNARMKATNGDMKHNFLRLRMVRCHRELKLDKSIPDFSYDSWRKAWHLYCEFGTRGLIVEFRGRGGHCFKGSKLVNSMSFSWNDLLRAPSITLTREIDQVRVLASVTPPVQAPYLLKCVPDRVTDDSGAMISDVILKLNNYRPQKGRWLSRTVLDHAGRECFVVRIRVGEGFWRRGAETPSAVNREDRIIEIREGSWSYVAGSIGRAPEKVVGTATPKESPDQWQAAWQFSTGDELLINCGSSTSSSSLSFSMKSRESSDSFVMLLRGRKMQYQDKETESKVAEDEQEDDDGFVTLVRFTEENPTGRATALLNWRLLVVELSPEEDAILVLLLCISILRTVSEMSKEDAGGLLVRQRLKEAKLGARDWGSIVLHPSSLSSSNTSPYLQPWYWNASQVMAQHEDTGYTRKPAPVEGGDMLYRRGIIT
ncbi:hypothetical protein ERO13_D08G224700v2 [Gossypium hirsutum]|uniref:Uncharacterized protein isoform X2 n=1 Tax=Gossypium hirsutum TaxID=3635 RepID=A0A1U8IPW2_GOSHI|nr:uncharacterized protein LOC107899076 isoform X2 [Gossypium hirsutum]KAG4135580.1 hypothetical protein ERO13_D08G224700v2 [Gossypium hirsutum]